MSFVEILLCILHDISGAVYNEHEHVLRSVSLALISFCISTLYT